MSNFVIQNLFVFLFRDLMMLGATTLIGLTMKKLMGKKHVLKILILRLKKLKCCLMKRN
jgi:hypothetical protein